MKAYFKEISLAIIVLVSALYLFQNWRTSAGSKPEGVSPDGPTTACLSENFEMADEWLEGLLPKGKKVSAITNWRQCGRNLRRGDIVLYRVSNAHTPVARILAAQPGDRFRLISVSNGWNIEIEGRIYTELGSGKPYRFGSAAPPLIRLFEKEHDGHLDSTSILLFSTKAPGEEDSGSLGVLNVIDVVGIVDATAL